MEGMFLLLRTLPDSFVQVENSWGEKSGKKGYLSMSDEWFDEYMYEVLINKKYLPQDVVDISSQVSAASPVPV